MAIKYSKAHADFKKAITGKFQKAIKIQSNSIKSKGFAKESIAPKKIEDFAPHKVYSMTQKMLNDGLKFRDANLVGMRLFHPDNNEAAFETVCDAKDSDHKYAGINSGNHVKATKVAMLLAEELEEVQKTNYELAFLQIPSLYIMAVWLRARKGWKNDIFIPITPHKKSLTENRSIKSLSKRRKLSLVQPKKITNKTISIKGRAYFAEDFHKMITKTKETRVDFDLTPKDD